MTSAEWKVLCAKPPVVLDGSWGTQLHALGLKPGAASERWNLDHPEEVRSLAEKYVGAGSAIVLTNTFGGNRISLARHELGEQTVDINRRAAELSKQAADGRAYVFGSIGPTGKLLMTGDVTEQELRTAFEEQANALREGGVDALVIETMADLEEAKIAVRAAAATALPVVACMVYDSGPNADRTMMGISPAQAAVELQEEGAWALGANCGQGPGGYAQLCAQYREASSLPLWMKPNAGLPEMMNGQPVYRVSPAEFAAEARRLVDAGATFIGGCCGTGPSFVAALRTALSTS